MVYLDQPYVVKRFFNIIRKSFQHIFMTYANFDTSFSYCPIPNNGGAANINANNQTIQIYFEDQYLLTVIECHVRCKRTTDKYLIIANAVIVHIEFKPSKKFANEININFDNNIPECNKTY